MGIIKELLTKVNKLVEKILLLTEKLRLVETRLNNVASKVQTPQVSHFTPNLTKTLDADNIWMGEKGISEYANMAKLDVYYDEENDKWKAGGWSLELIEENTVYIIPPEVSPPSSYPTAYYIVSNNYTKTIVKDSQLRLYFLVREIKSRRYDNGSLTSDTLAVHGIITGGSISGSNIVIAIVSSQSRMYQGTAYDDYYGYPWTEILRYESDCHYKLYEIKRNFGNRVLS